jgi:hypothetical protein
MIYAFILGGIYCLFLTLFVVKLQNKMTKIEERLDASVLPISKLKEEVAPPPPTILPPSPTNIDEAARQFEEILNSKSKEEIDQWINEDEVPKPSLGEGTQNLNNLNKGYNKTY